MHENSGMATSEKLKSVVEKLEKRVSSLREQAKATENQLKEIKSKFAQVDREAAKTLAKDELKKARAKVETQLVKLSGDVLKTVDRIKTDKAKIRSLAEEALSKASHQVKLMVEIERNKRRARNGRS